MLCINFRRLQSRHCRCLVCRGCQGADGARLGPSRLLIQCAGPGNSHEVLVLYMLLSPGLWVWNRLLGEHLQL